MANIRAIVVKNHGGTIVFSTEPSKGTTFHIRLPIPGPEEAPASDSGGP
jgi:signal transduction histidine kinase